MNETNSSCWIQTFSGKQFDPFLPQIKDIDIDDIAHALSNICRFTGHCRKFYSVAQHSCIVFDLAEECDKGYALLHDASEAYLCDLARPIKRHPEMGFYLNAERILQQAIYCRFGLYQTTPAEIKALDSLVLATEAMAFGLMTPSWALYGTKPVFDISKFIPWDHARAEAEFMHRYFTHINPNHKMT